MSTYEQAKGLKRWRIVLVLALAIVTVGNGLLLADRQDLKTNCESSLQIETNRINTKPRER